MFTNSNKSSSNSKIIHVHYMVIFAPPTQMKKPELCPMRREFHNLWRGRYRYNYDVFSWSPTTESTEENIKFYAFSRTWTTRSHKFHNLDRGFKNVLLLLMIRAKTICPKKINQQPLGGIYNYFSMITFKFQNMIKF